MLTLNKTLYRTPSFVSRLIFVFLVLALAACKPGEDKPGDGDGDCKKGKGHSEDCTSTSTGTSTSTSTSTDVATFPELPERVCTVDRFQQGDSQQIIKKVDVLFMMDHSGSMQDDWERVANNIQNLVKELPSDADIRYAVILGDVGTWRGKIYAPSKTAKVLNNQTQTVQEISNDLHKIFVEGMKINDAGTGEALFNSLHYAVTTNAVANQKLGFFRPDAALSVIFMSDEQEIGFPFPSDAVLASQGLPYRCDASQEDKIKRDYYDKNGLTMEVTFQALKALKGDMPVKTHAFINLTKEDLFKRNSKNAKCLYDSLGYGYKEIVDKTKGVLFSIQDNKADGLAQCGRVIKESLTLQHEFALSKPANKVDPATIIAAVDAANVPHEYRLASNSVYLENAGVARSLIEIRHCEPDGRVSWNLTGFNGTPAQRSVGLSWQTAEYATNGKVLWGLAANALSNTASDGVIGTSHSVTVSGLEPNTVYFFQAVSADEFGQSKSSEVKSFRTLPDWSISGVSSQAARTSASISWNTAEYGTKGKVLWGLAANAFDNESAQTAVGNGHQVDLIGLAPSTEYFFQCVSADEYGLEKRSSVASFTTQADWGIIGFTGQSTRTTVALAFSTPDQATTSKVVWGSAAASLNNEVAAAGNGLDHAVTVSGLNPSTDYYFQAVATDPNGVEKRSLVMKVRTLNDWAIIGFAGTSTQTSVSVAWTTPGYNTNGHVFWGTTDTSLTNVVADAANGESHSVTVNNLNADTVYYFQASSVDSEGVEKRSSVVAIRTQAIPLPTWEIADFAGTSTVNSATLTWSTSQYATSGKILWGTALDSINNEVLEGSTGTTHSVLVPGLAADTLYYFQAVSTDDRGQQKQSDVIAVRTMQDPITNPPTNWVIIGFDGTTTVNQANLIWQTPGAQTKATVKVGLTPDDLTHMTVAVNDYADTHVIGVSGLAPNTLYYFQVIAVDNTGRTVESVVISKRTKLP